MSKDHFGVKSQNSRNSIWIWIISYDVFSPSRIHFSATGSTVKVGFVRIDSHSGSRSGSRTKYIKSEWSIRVVKFNSLFRILLTLKFGSNRGPKQKSWRVSKDIQGRTTVPVSVELPNTFNDTVSLQFSQ